MKKIFIIALALTAAFSLTGCKDFLDTLPTTSVASGNMWTTEDMADAGMAGLWYPLYKHDLTRTQLRMEDYDGLNRAGIEACGFCSQMVSGNYPLHILARNNLQAMDFQVRLEWTTLYTVVHACNDALANLHKANLPESKYQRYLCEARLLRAYVYSRLNMLYGGVPIYDKPVTNEECIKVQSSMTDVWNFIIDDCTFAIENDNCPNNNLTSNYGAPSKGTAHALRGMAYMWLASNRAVDAAYPDETVTPLSDTEVNAYYEKAVADFTKVEECGYGFWEGGKWGDLFQRKNEKNREVILPLQFNSDAGFCSNWQMFIGGRNHHDSWQSLMPSADFVDYYQNADGSKFDWASLPGLEDWNKLTPQQREVFFLRDGLEDIQKNIDAYNEQLAAATTQEEKDFINERKGFMTTLQLGRETSIQKIGKNIYDQYYLNSGNEARVLQAYANRDPRLQETVIVPYTDVLCYRYDEQFCHYKQNRWPYAGRDNNETKVDGEYLCEHTDYYQCEQSTLWYIYKKGLVLDNSLEGGSQARSRCDMDWYLIRYTQIALEKAEALCRLNRDGEALTIVNKIRTRAGMPSISAGGEELLEAIRYESRVELCQEGVNFFEETRWGTWKDMKFISAALDGALLKSGARNTWGDYQYGDKWYLKENMWPWSISDRVAQKNQQMKHRQGWTY